MATTMMAESSRIGACSEQPSGETSDRVLTSRCLGKRFSLLGMTFFCPPLHFRFLLFLEESVELALDAGFRKVVPIEGPKVLALPSN